LQIGFFIVQMRVAAEQDRRSAELYRDTNAVLTKIDERSSATVAVIREQFDFVLRHALGQGPSKAVAELVAPGGDGATGSDDEPGDEEGSESSPCDNS
jgi:hypothetical protein